MKHILRYLLINGNRKKKVECEVDITVHSVEVEVLQQRACELFNVGSIILQIWDKGFEDWVDLEDGDPVPTNSRIKVEVQEGVAATTAPHVASTLTTTPLTTVCHATLPAAIVPPPAAAGTTSIAGPGLISAAQLTNSPMPPASIGPGPGIRPGPGPSSSLVTSSVAWSPRPACTHHQGIALPLPQSEPCACDNEIPSNYDIDESAETVEIPDPAVSQNVKRSNQDWFRHFRFPEFPAEIVKKLRRGDELRKCDRGVILDYIYRSVTKITFYPSASDYASVTDKLIRSYPKLTTHDPTPYSSAREMWRQKIMHKFKNCRKRGDNSVPIVAQHKRYHIRRNRKELAESYAHPDMETMETQNTENMETHSDTSYVDQMIDTDSDTSFGKSNVNEGVIKVEEDQEPDIQYYDVVVAADTTYTNPSTAM